ncbi:hypothetical protein SAMN04489713_1285 [Actinomadura madurae]|uniref:Uncharacterized protein n=1 Tax=Actinomadura madurae TaxID=1993 RepID=A0A1I5XR60_9ACTN|nr:hypothetical protein SAMN04489713_1285 [Actinomadura madurae]
MGWVEPKKLNAGAPISCTTVYLDQLAHEIIRQGWKAVPRYDGPHPLLRVFDPAVPDFGESITLVPGTTPDVWWYRSSTGENLAPHTKPARAAERITRILLPFVTAALAARTHQRQTSETGLPTPPSAPDPIRARTIAELHARFGVISWWGTHTKEWWALLPSGTQWRLLNAPTPAALTEAILHARATR